MLGCPRAQAVPVPHPKARLSPCPSPGVPLRPLVFAQCLEVFLPQVPLGSCDSPGEVSPHPGDRGDNGRGVGHSGPGHLLSFDPFLCRLLQQEAPSPEDPLLAGECWGLCRAEHSEAGSCRVPGRAGARRMEPGEGAGLRSTSHPLAVPQQWQLDGSPVLKDISQLQVRRDRARGRRREPEDEVRGAARPGGGREGTERC